MDEKAHRSPGLRHRHYRPEAEVRWVGPFGPSGGERVAGEGHQQGFDRKAGRGTKEVPMTTVEDESTHVRIAYIGLDAPPDPNRYARLEIVPSLESYARELFHFFRMCESEGIQVIDCERVSPEGLGQALIDRIDRAAGAE